MAEQEKGKKSRPGKSPSKGGKGPASPFDHHGSKQEAASKEERLTLVFHALGDPSRRQIIDLLRESPALKVGNIAAAFEMSLNGVSKHIKVLERAGLVVRHVEGRDHFLAVNWPTLELVSEWLDFYRQFWSGRLDNLEEVLKKRNEE